MFLFIELRTMPASGLATGIGLAIGIGIDPGIATGSGPDAAAGPEPHDRPVRMRVKAVLRQTMTRGPNRASMNLRLLVSGSDAG
jgi:hypothetical protein